MIVKNKKSLKIQMTPEDKEIKIALKPFLSRILFEHYLTYFVRGVMAASILTAAMLLVSFFEPWPEVFRYCLTLCLVGILLFMLTAFWRRPGYFKTACRVDAIGLKERVVTALEYVGVSSPVINKQKEDTLVCIKNSVKTKDLPVRLPVWEGKVLTITILIIIVLIVIPNPMQEEAERKVEFRKAKIEQMTRVDQLIKELEQKQQQQPLSERQALISVLKELEKGINKSDSARDAAKAISEAENKLKDILPKENISNQSEIEKLVSELSKQDITRDLGNKIQSGDIRGSQEALNKLSQRNVSNSLKEKEQAANLSRAAKNMTDPRLKSILNDLGILTKNGSTSDAGRVASLKQTVGSLSSQAGLVNDIDQATGFLSQMKQNFMGNGRYAANMPQANRPGNTGSNSVGSSQGFGSNNTGNGGTASGNSGDQEIGAGGGAGMGKSQNNDINSLPISASQETSGGALSPVSYGEYEKIFDPRRVNSSGESSFVAGKPGEGEEQIAETTDEAAMPGSMRPYREVIGNYRYEAYKTLERESIPPGMAEIVKNYFSVLEE